MGAGMSFPTYPEYRESGVEWLGRLPQHWAISKLKHCATFSGGGTPSREKPAYWGGSIPWVSPKDMKSELTCTAEEFITVEGLSESSTSLVEPGAVLLVVRSGILKHTIPAAINAVPVALNQDMKALRFSSAEYARFFLRYVQGHNDQLLPLWSKQGATVESIEHSFLGETPVVLPPPDEVSAIAAFLDRETAKIDALVEAQRRLIALLKEKRQAVISHAVTKGLNPAAPMKDTGIEWLGQIPAHWEVRKLRSVARLESGHTPSRQRPEYWVEDECVIPWFTLADVGSLRDGTELEIYETSQKISPLGMANSAARLLPPNTVILSRTASVGFSGIARIALAVSQDFAAWICGGSISSEYLLQVLQSMKPEFARLMMGSTHQTIYMPDIEAFRVPVPPPNEQSVIVQKVAALTAEIDGHIEAAQDMSALLLERRAALISAAVTGKIDVRGLAPVVETQPAAWVRDQVSAQIISLQAHQPTFGRVKFQKQVYLAETHAGVHEIGGRYVREAAGPYDRELIASVEENLKADNFMAVKQEAKGAAVTYHPKHGAKVEIEALSNALGDRAARLAHVIDTTKDLKTAEIEAVATLYAVWNDLLIDSAAVTDDRIITGVLKEWHPEKAGKFTKASLQQWLNWMRRHELTPSGQGPRTQIGDLI
jgi:type I restriction enzyme S subunit